jgi:hypothetical protein
MALENDVDLAADLVSVKDGAGDAKADGHELHGYDSDFSIVSCLWIIFVDLVEEVGVRPQPNTDSMDEEDR